MKWLHRFVLSSLEALHPSKWNMYKKVFCIKLCQDQKAYLEPSFLGDKIIYMKCVGLNGLNGLSCW